MLQLINSLHICLPSYFHNKINIYYHKRKKQTRYIFKKRHMNQEQMSQSTQTNVTEIVFENFATQVPVKNAIELPNSWGDQPNVADPTNLEGETLNSATLDETFDADQWLVADEDDAVSTHNIDNDNNNVHLQKRNDDLYMQPRTFVLASSPSKSVAMRIDENQHAYLHTFKDNIDENSKWSIPSSLSRCPIEDVNWTLSKEVVSNEPELPTRTCVDTAEVFSENQLLNEGTHLDPDTTLLIRNDEHESSVQASLGEEFWDSMRTSPRPSFSDQNNYNETMGHSRTNTFSFWKTPSKTSSCSPEASVSFSYSCDSSSQSDSGDCTQSQEYESSPDSGDTTQVLEFESSPESEQLSQISQSTPPQSLPSHILPPPLRQPELPTGQFPLELSTSDIYSDFDIPLAGAQKSSRSEKPTARIKSPKQRPLLRSRTQVQKLMSRGVRRSFNGIERLRCQPVRRNLEVKEVHGHPSLAAAVKASGRKNLPRFPNKGLIKCSPSCPAIYTTWHGLAKHIDEAHNSLWRPYECPHEDCIWSILGFITTAECSRHIKSAHTMVKLRCELCEIHGIMRRFSRPDVLRRHIRQFHCQFSDSMGNDADDDDDEQGPIIKQEFTDL